MGALVQSDCNPARYKPDQAFAAVAVYLKTQAEIAQETQMSAESGAELDTESSYVLEKYQSSTVAPSSTDLSMEADSLDGSGTDAAERSPFLKQCLNNLVMMTIMIMMAMTREVLNPCLPLNLTLVLAISFPCVNIQLIPVLISNLLMASMNA